MTDIADRLKNVREFIINRQCFCTQIGATCERCEALAAMPDPDAVVTKDQYDSTCKTLSENTIEMSRLQAALRVVDEEEGCCAPGEWCHYKTYSELALDHVDAMKQRDELADALRNMLYRGGRLIENDGRDYMVVPHEETVAEARAALAKLEEKS